MRLVDSHCHIDGEAFQGDLDDVIARATAAGVCAMLNIGTGRPDSHSFERTRELADSVDIIYGAAGIHPHDAIHYNDELEQRLLAICASSEKMIAWGEIGLDYHYDHSPRDVQREIFRRQLETAINARLPVIIHSRNANEDTEAILVDACDTPEFKGGIMHCFAGTPEMAERLISIGFLISFAGNVTFKNADDIRSALAAVPLDKLLIETDSPYLTPVPHRGKRNEPARVADTAAFVADFLGASVEEIADTTTSNFFAFFGLPNKPR